MDSLPSAEGSSIETVMSRDSSVMGRALPASSGRSGRLPTTCDKQELLFPGQPEAPHEPSQVSIRRKVILFGEDSGEAPVSFRCEHGSDEALPGNMYLRGRWLRAAFYGLLPNSWNRKRGRGWQTLARRSSTSSPSCAGNHADSAGLKPRRSVSRTMSRGM